MTGIAERVAGAPISWGVCEVPGWGWQYDAATVLGQMRAVGLTATEFGPDGFLPADPAERASLLDGFGLRPVGGFVPVRLHDPAYDPVPGIRRVLDEFTAAGATALVLSAAGAGTEGYDGRRELGERGWATLLGNLDRLAAVAAAQGITATLHPHVGTMVVDPADVGRVLAGSAIGLCLDTGHLLIGGVDPVALAQEHTGRIRHVHLKDADADLAARVQAGQVSYTAAVRDGIYRPLGAGDIDVGAIVSSLERAGYQGWYVLEQDIVLDADPGDPGPGDEDPSHPVTGVQASLEHLLGIGAGRR